MWRIVIADLRASWRTWAGIVVVFVAIQASTVCLALIVASGQALDDPRDAQQLVDAVVGFGLFVVLAVLAVTGASVELVVAQRRGALARWSLAGATPRQIVVLVVIQVLAVSVAAAMVGSAIALATIAPVLAYLADAGIGPAQVPTVRDVGAVGWGVAAGAVLAVLGAWRQARAISRVPPVEALRRSTAPAGGMTRVRWVLTVLLLAALGGAFAMMPQATSVDDAASLSFVVALLAVLLVAAAAPGVLPRLTSAWTAAVPAVVSPAWFLARRSCVARAPRLSGVVVPVALAIALFVGLLSISGTLAASVSASTGSTAPGGAQTSDLVITIGLPLLVAVAGALGGLLMSGRQRDVDLAVAGIAGATPRQRLTQALFEAIIVAATGLLLGVLAAATGLLVTIIGLRNVLPVVEVQFPWAALLAIAAATGAVAILATVLPALGTLRHPPHRTLAEDA